MRATKKHRLPEFKVIEITLAKIRGIDPDIQKFLTNVGYVPDTSIDLDAWSETSARLIYYRLPMYLVERKLGEFDVIGDGRTLNLAQRLFDKNETFPALCLSAKRLSAETKLSLMAIEIYGLAPLYRTRRNLPVRSMSVWEALTDAGVPTINGLDPKSFSRGSGYSLTSLQKKAATKAAELKVDQLEEVVHSKNSDD
jgi:hypothetical protein